jgi:hypothetical protein
VKTKIISLLFVLVLVTSTSASIHIPPRIDSAPDDLSYVEGSTGNTLSWTARAHESNDNPTVYIVRLDGEIMEDHNEESWQDDVAVVVNVDGLAVGQYTVEIEFRDNGYPGQADASFDSATVTVTSADASSTSDTSDSQTSDSQTSEATSDTQSTATEETPVSLLFIAPVVLIPVLRRKL